MGSIDSLVQKMLSKCSLGQGSVSQSLQLWSSEVRETRTIPCQSVVESIHQLKGGGVSVAFAHRVRWISLTWTLISSG